MMLSSVVVQPLGLYRNADTLRSVRTVEVTCTLSWVNLYLKSSRSPCTLLAISLETAQARELRDFLTAFLKGDFGDEEGGGR